MTRRAAILALIALAFLIAPERANPEMLTGYASAYAPGVMGEVVRTRFDNGWWPVKPVRNWYESHGAIAVADCRRVGEMATLIDSAGREYRVLIADCGERGKPGEGGHWMRENRIVAELDWRLWQRLTAEHGRPLEIGLR